MRATASDMMALPDALVAYVVDLWGQFAGTMMIGGDARDAMVVIQAKVSRTLVKEKRETEK